MFTRAGDVTDRNYKNNVRTGVISGRTDVETDTWTLLQGANRTDVQQEKRSEIESEHLDIQTEEKDATWPQVRRIRDKL